MTIHYKNFFSLFTQEKERLDKVIAGRQDGPPALSFQTPLTVAAALLGLGLGSLLLETSAPKQKLQDHDMCGITTGGQVGFILIGDTNNSTYHNNKFNIQF